MSGPAGGPGSGGAPSAGGGDGSGGPVGRPLGGIRVLDRTTGVAGPYCTKLLADAGADVVTVEAPGGEPLRRWRSGALFEYLHAGKRSVTEDGAPPAGAADLLVTERAGARQVRAEHPGLVVVTITPFGTDGPWAGRPATEFTLQAASGSIGHRGLPEQPPLAAGGRLGEWLTGTYAALAAAAALRTATATGRGELVDVAMLDCMAVSMSTYPSVFHQFLGWPAIRGTNRTVEVPSILPTADGWIVVTTNSAAQFESLLLMIGRPDLLADPDLARVTTRFARRDEFLGAVHRYTTTRSSAELLEEAAALRIPAGPVLDGAAVSGFEQFVARDVFATVPGGRLPLPRTPYLLAGATTRAAGPAPALGEADGSTGWAGPAGGRPDHADAGGGAPPGTAGLPLAGLRVLDCTAWWAGPAATHVMACLGADVVKVESTGRPDLMRYTTVKSAEVARWWEWGPIFHGANAGKRGVTIDLARPEGISVFEQLLDTADVLVENYTPRVMDQFGLGWSRIHERNPRAIMVRMPAFGLDGPWRDRTGFAQTMESITGMAWLTGFPDGPPVLVRGACDPLAGMHAVFATLVALRQRERDGSGLLVEVPMVEAALPGSVEAVLEHEAGGPTPHRDGNRGPLAAPQGAYRCAGEDTWVAMAVADDAQWEALCRLIGLAPELRAAADGPHGRRGAQDEIDRVLAAWFGAADAGPAAARLRAAGIPAEIVVPARDIALNPQLRHRRLFEVEDHPVTGRTELPGLPFRFASVDRWLRRPSPTLGQHNDEVLGPLLGAAQLDRLREAGVVGERPTGT